MLSSDSTEQNISISELLYLYHAEDLWYFMDPATYEELCFHSEEDFVPAVQLMENTLCQVSYCQKSLISISLPQAAPEE